MEPEIAEDLEMAKSTLTNSKVDDSIKKTLFRVLNISSTATNGISPEEKIQKMSEAVFSLVTTFVCFISSMDRHIEKIQTKHCDSCPAMEFTNEERDHHAEERMLEELKKKHNLVEASKVQSQTHGKTIIGSRLAVVSGDVWSLLKDILVKPYFWIFGSIMFFSPYAVDIINALKSAFH